MTIYRDGVQISSKPVQLDFTNDRFIRSYVRLFTQTGNIIVTQVMLFRENSTKTVVLCLLLISHPKWIQARSILN